MKLRLWLLSFFLMLSLLADAQSLSFHIGDPAPPLKVSAWVKGDALQELERGQVYVIDFWASWCKYCLVAMPYLSDLADKYKNKVRFLGIDILERKKSNASILKWAKNYVDTMGDKINFPIAIDDSDFMAKHWMKAFHVNAIPTDFIVNEQGKVVWIGHPKYLDKILSQILDKSWNIKKERSKREKNIHLRMLDREIVSKTLTPMYSRMVKEQMSPSARADSLLSVIHGIVTKQPELKFTPGIANQTFLNLLISNPRKAYEYGKKLLKTDDYASILSRIKYPGDRQLPGYIYGLGADIYQKLIDHINPIFSNLWDTSGIYHKMSAWYLLAGDTLKAEEAKRKSYNATIIVRKTNEQKDTTSSAITLLHPYYLSSDTLWATKKTNLSKGRRSYTYSTYLQHPTIFKTGGVNSYWLIKPGDSMLLVEEDGLSNTNYLFSVQDNSGLKLPKNSTDTILKKRAPDLFYPYYAKDNREEIPAVESWLNKAFDTKHIEATALVASKNYLKNNPGYSNSRFDRRYLKSWYMTMILLRHEKVWDSLKNTLQQNTRLLRKGNNQIIHLAAYVDRHATLKIKKYWKVTPVNYWKGVQNLSRNIVNNTVRKQQNPLDTIEKILRPFGDTTRQYILLDLLRNKQSKLNQNDLNRMTLASQIQLKIFQPYLKEYLRDKVNTGSGYLSIPLRSVLLYNTEMKLLNLDSMFRSTKHPYLYVTLCGTWNSSSINEIKTYSENQEYKHPEIRSVWLFFENNQTDWLKVIEKYHLPQQDCFMVKSHRKMERYFSEDFGWHKKFPSHFLFTKEGKCLKENSSSITDFEQKKNDNYMRPL